MSYHSQISATDISHVTGIEWFKKLRKLMKEFLEKDPVTLGNSEGSVVEIDESLFGKKAKYHRGEAQACRYQFQLIIHMYMCALAW